MVYGKSNLILEVNKKSFPVAYNKKSEVGA